MLFNFDSGGFRLGWAGARLGEPLGGGWAGLDPALLLRLSGAKELGPTQLAAEVKWKAGNLESLALNDTGNCALFVSRLLARC